MSSRTQGMRRNLGRDLSKRRQLVVPLQSLGTPWTREEEEVARSCRLPSRMFAMPRKCRRSMRSDKLSFWKNCFLLGTMTTTRCSGRSIIGIVKIQIMHKWNKKRHVFCRYDDADFSRLENSTMRKASKCGQTCSNGGRNLELTQLWRYTSIALIWFSLSFQFSQPTKTWFILSIIYLSTRISSSMNSMKSWNTTHKATMESTRMAGLCTLKD